MSEQHERQIAVAGLKPVAVRLDNGGGLCAVLGASELLKVGQVGIRRPLLVHAVERSG